jgi:hypothetical protein
MNVRAQRGILETDLRFDAEWGGPLG